MTLDPHPELRDTALQGEFARSDLLSAGRTVLVTGAAGRVGFYAVQFAKAAGASVIATAGRDASLQAARDAGADHVVDYATQDVAAAVMEFTGGAGVDRVVDVEFGVNLDITLAVIRPGGVVATYSSSARPEPVLPFYPLMFRDVTVRFVLVYAMPESAKQAAVTDINRALAAHAIRLRGAPGVRRARGTGARTALRRKRVPACRGRPRVRFVGLESAHAPARLACAALSWCRPQSGRFNSPSPKLFT